MVGLAMIEVRAGEEDELGSGGLGLAFGREWAIKTFFSSRVCKRYLDNQSVSFVHPAFHQNQFPEL